MSKTEAISDEIHLKVMDILEKQPQISQRELSDQLDVSLGKLNYCLKALLEKGLIKASNFKTSQNKRGYIYMLTPAGIEQKTQLTVKFLKRKMAEYDRLEQEIEYYKNQLN